ncbi:MAG TPA: hypothetical protein VFQ35_24415 [Polyangiaceae bacterium]|nr:hypothetical protein [Polyangiaceae bacterium]
MLRVSILLLRRTDRRGAPPPTLVTHARTYRVSNQFELDRITVRA